MGFGFSSSFTDLNTGLFGDDSEGSTSTGPQHSTKTTNDSGQNQTTNTTSTTNNNSTTTNSGSVNSNYNSGSRDTQNIGSSVSTTYNSGRVDTSQLMLTPEAVTHLVNQILEGTSGLAAVSSGQHVAGGYNSSAATLLTNDLLTRTAGEVAARAAVTKTTIGSSTSTTTNSGSTNTFDHGASYGYQSVGGSTSNTTGTNTTNNSGVVTTGPRKVDEEIHTDATTTNTEKDGKGLLDWIICTELRRQGRMPNRIYVPGARKFKEYDEQIKRGYYIWAVPSVQHLRKNPKSLYSKFLEVLFNARGEYLAKNKTVGGFVATYGVHAFCWMLSRTIATNYTYSRSSVYPQGAN